MSKREIEIEGLPEGWKAVAIRKALDTDTHIFINGEVFEISTHPEMINPKQFSHLIVEKIQPRRIENIDENALNEAGWCFVENYNSLIQEKLTGKCFNNIKPLLKLVIKTYLEKCQVKETGVSLTKDEPKLKIGQVVRVCNPLGIPSIVYAEGFIKQIRGFDALVQLTRPIGDEYSIGASIWVTQDNINPVKANYNGDTLELHIDELKQLDMYGMTDRAVTDKIRAFIKDK